MIDLYGFGTEQIKQVLESSLVTAVGLSGIEVFPTHDKNTVREGSWVKDFHVKFPGRRELDAIATVSVFDKECDIVFKRGGVEVMPSCLGRVSVDSNYLEEVQ